MVVYMDTGLHRVHGDYLIQLHEHFESRDYSLAGGRK